MRLINTTTFALEEFLSADDEHPYAILSHTWDEDEVTFQDWENLGPEVRRQKKGFAKIEQTCIIAKQRGLQYAWVDTCCINKESSAELTEAINSMFAWYQQATFCLVYLSDLPAHEPSFPDPLLPACRWWTRGWTLQELIAPRNLNFYDCEWNDHGGKRMRSEEVSKITGIDLAALENINSLKSMPVGRKMSWAALRQTTREEDMAYCLLGIFDVNMSLIYGERGKAFTRLQEEILKKTNDMTLFAWTCQKQGQQSKPSSTLTPKGCKSQMYRGILARSPVEFVNCREVMPDHALQLNKESALTNSGLRIKTSLIEMPESDYILFIGSQLVGRGFETKKIGIRLLKTPSGFYRRLPTELFFRQDDDDNMCLKTTEPATLYIHRDVSPRESIRVQHRLWYVRLTLDLPEHLQLASVKVKPSNIWNSPTQSFICESGRRYHAVVHIRLLNTKVSKTTTNKKKAYSRFTIICELHSAPQEGRPHIVWSLVCSEADARKVSSPWSELQDLIDGYMASADEAADVPLELSDRCAQLAVAARTPQYSQLYTRRGARTGIATHRWPGELNVSFVTVSWWRRGELWWHGPDVKGYPSGAAVSLTKRWTRSTLGSDESHALKPAKTSWLL